MDQEVVNDYQKQLFVAHKLDENMKNQVMSKNELGMRKDGSSGMQARQKK